MNNGNTNFSIKSSDIERTLVIVLLFLSTAFSIEILTWIVIIPIFSTETILIELSRVIMVFFSTKISIEILMNFSTQISDIELSEVIVVLKYRTKRGDRGAIFQY